MSTIIRNTFIGVGALSATAIGGFACWVKEMAENLPADQKGSLLSRMQLAINSFEQTKKIQDAYTAERHLYLANSLSSKEFTVTSDRSQKEIDALKISYYAGYIAEALQKNPGITPPIFRYDTDLPVALPTLPGEMHKGFVFAGISPQIHDSQAREAILDGTYLRCKSGLEITDPNATSTWSKYKKVDVIIAGTTDQKKCGQFKKEFMRDLAYLAASSPRAIDSKHPYSDTPVFDLSEKGLESTGDLTDMPEQTKEKILLGNLTACEFYSQQKTRLSGGRYKEVGAIVAGTSNEKVCDVLFFRKLREITAQSRTPS